MLGKNQSLNTSQLGGSGSCPGSTKIIEALGVKADGLIGIVPAGYVIEIIVILETGGAPANINLGDVDLGGQILPNEPIAANSSDLVNSVYADNATLAAFKLFLSNNLAWVATTLDVYIILRKIR